MPIHVRLIRRERIGLQSSLAQDTWVPLRSTHATLAVWK